MVQDNQAQELETQSLEELEELIRAEEARKDKLRTSQEAGFGLAGPEVAPVTDEEVEEALNELDRAIKIRHISDLRREQRDVLAGIKRRTATELKRARGFPPPREVGAPRPSRARAQRRQMFAVDETCASCGARITELPFRPDPGRPVYCPRCYTEGRGQRGSSPVGTAFGEAFQRREAELQAWEDDLRQREATLGGGGPGKGGRRPSKAERRRQRRAQREQQEE